ncbi:hypothetical protein D3C76_1136170 [compost metagenome]
MGIILRLRLKFIGKDDVKKQVEIICSAIEKLYCLKSCAGQERLNLFRLNITCILKREMSYNYFMHQDYSTDWCIYGDYASDNIIQALKYSGICSTGKLPRNSRRFNMSNTLSKGAMVY